MKSVLLLCAIAACAAAQPYFQPAEMMNIGVYYYPEAWPESQWPRDMANIRKLGLEFVHMGEFAWAFMEPQEGSYDFEWLDKNVRLAGDQNLKVVLCTPSATPPIWLVRKHPEVLMVDAHGRRMQHGSREHACWSVPAYREYVGKIVTELAKRFGNDPRVWGWQIDNELSHYGKRYCYCDFCQAKFRVWLREKYGTIDRLNRDWGDAFWSQTYQAFDEIRIPNQEELVAGVNPHALLDFERWFAAEAADYLRFQARILRQYSKNQWVTTNFMSLHPDVYPPLSGKDLDILTWTIYPVHGNLNEGPLGFRLGDGAGFSFMHDFLRPVNGFEGIMELQPGQVNWGDVNPRPYPGAIRMWILRSFAAGGKLVCTYRYRQPLYGGELYHNGLVETDGVTPSIGGKEYAQAMREIRQLREHYRPNAAEPPDYAARRTALLYNVENRWDMDNHTQTTRWDSMGHLLRYYKVLKSVGAPVDVITEEKDFARYPFLIAPAYQLVDAALVQRLEAYVRNGGRLVLSCRTAQKDRRGQLWEGAWAEPIHKLIGASIPAYDVLPKPHQGSVRARGKAYAWASWGEMLEPASGTSVLAQYAGDFYAGKAAAVSHKLGKGSVTYIGVESLSGDLERDLIREVFTAAGVRVQNFENQFFVDWRDGFWVATNFSSRKQSAPIPENAKILIGARELDPAGVAVWTE
ncbi:MAG TPA: beta-galactosidase [Bryobacteraceae bacterium]|nr:beta-galactosidase [Bryobacteraceae bacterium]